MNTIINNYYSIEDCADWSKKLDEIMHIINKDIKK